MIRLQNIVAALAFAAVVIADTAMQMLNLLPASGLLWQINIAFARELRPVIELFDHVSIAGPATVPLCLAGLLAMCLAASRLRHTMMTAATTHTALFGAIYAAMASFGANLGPQISTAAGVGDIVGIAVGLSLLDQVLIAMVLALLIVCTLNHYHILRESLDRLRGVSAAA